MQPHKILRSFLGAKLFSSAQEGEIAKPAVDEQQPERPDLPTDFLSPRHCETIAVSSARLAAMGPHLAKVAGNMEEHASQQARQAARTAEATRRLTERLNNAVVHLREASGNVQAIMGDIARIADQTRILSINASIEAARAGEHGRAFNVVACEVQRLADQTRESTRTIEERIQAIEASVRELAASVAEEGQRAPADGVEAAVTVQAVNTQIQAMANSAESQRDEAHSLHALGDRTNQLTEELLLAVGQFRLEVHRQAEEQIRDFLPAVAEAFGERRPLENLLLGWLQQHTGFELLYVTNGEGRQVVDNIGWQAGRAMPDPGAYGREWRTRPWYQQAIRQPESTAISDIYRSTATGDFCFTVSAVVHGPGGESLGVLGADVNFQRLLTGDLGR